MYRKDYILRMIEMLGELISSILGLIKKGNFGEASKAIEDAYQNFLHEDAAFFRIIPKENITHKLLVEHNYTNDHLEILAQLFYSEAELYYTQGKYLECLPYAEKALLLFEFIERESKTFSTDRNTFISILKTYMQKMQQNR